MCKMPTFQTYRSMLVKMCLHRILNAWSTFIYMEEIWKDVTGYEGLYQVSNKGNVKSVKRVVKRPNNTNLSVKERLLKTRSNRKGYAMVHLSKRGKEKSTTVHRLVAQAFIPNPNNLPQINHKDENKNNNCVENLEWCDNKYNMNYGTAIERTVKTKSERYNLSEISQKGQATKNKNNIGCVSIPVNQFTWDGIFLRRFYSSEQVKRELGINNAYAVAKGRKKHAGGYIWLYDKDIDKIKDRVLKEKPTLRK